MYICTLYIKKSKIFFTSKELNSTPPHFKDVFEKTFPNVKTWSPGSEEEWLNLRFLTNLLGLLCSYLDSALLLRARFANAALKEAFKIRLVPITQK